MPQLFANNAKTTLSASVPSTSQAFVQVVDGSLFPTPVDPDYALVTISNAAETLFEVVKLTTRSGNTLTVSRGAEGSAKLWDAGSKVELRLTAGFLNNTVGFRDIPVNYKNAHYNIVALDSGKSIIKNDTGVYTYSLPSYQTINFPVGTAITFVNNAGSGNMTIRVIGNNSTDFIRLAGVGTLGDRVLAPRGLATCLKVNYDTWMISGVGVT